MATRPSAFAIFRRPLKRAAKRKRYLAAAATTAVAVTAVAARVAVVTAGVDLLWVARLDGDRDVDHFLVGHRGADGDLAVDLRRDGVEDRPGARLLLGLVAAHVDDDFALD